MRDELAAIDATLAGGAVDPRHAELAELSLLLADLRAAPDPLAAARLDERLAAMRSRAPVQRRRPRALGALAGAAAALAAAVAAAVIVIGGVGGGGAPGGAAPSPREPEPLSARGAAATSTQAAQPSSSSAASGGTNLALQAPGRSVIQSAQLTLSAAPNRIEAVSSEVFAVVGASGGYVENSSVTQTGGPDGFAHFTLSLPSSGLGPAMAELSRLRFSQVTSRTDGSQDVTGSIDSLRRRLADAQALRTGLLRQLAGASTAAQIAGLRGQLHDTSVLIGRLSAALGHIRRSVAFSEVTLTVQAGTPVPVAPHSRSTLHRALHDAGRVLSTLAGVAVLVLAVALPLAAAALLCAWGWLHVRRRWRELALRE